MMNKEKNTLDTEENIVDQAAYTEEYYQSRCGGLEFFHRYKSDILKPTFQAAIQKATLKKGHTILDIGCGRGELVDHLGKKGHDVSGIDYSEAAIELAKKTFPDRSFMLMDVGELINMKKTYDRIFCLGTIEHLTDDQIDNLFNAVKKLLKPEGVFIVNTCTNRHYYKTWSYHFRDKLAQCLRALKLPIKRPLAPRSDEDVELHINEQSYFSLKNVAKRNHWHHKVSPQPNPKLMADALYGPKLAKEIYPRKSPGWKQTLYKTFIFRFPFNLLLGRCYLCVFRPK